MNGQTISEGLFVQKALDSKLNNSIKEFYEFRNFMNTWSLHKTTTTITRIFC